MGLSKPVSSHPQFFFTSRAKSSPAQRARAVISSICVKEWCFQKIVIKERKCGNVSRPRLLFNSPLAHLRTLRRLMLRWFAKALTALCFPERAKLSTQRRFIALPKYFGELGGRSRSQECFFIEKGSFLESGAISPDFWERKF